MSEHIEPTASSMTLIPPNGLLLPLHAVVDPDNRRLFQAPFSFAGNGIYTVVWQVISVDDGHFTRGSYQFTVGTSSMLLMSASSVHYHASLKEAVTIWFKLIGQYDLLALCAFLFLFGKLSGISSPLRARVVSYAQRYFVAITTLLIVGVVSYVWLETGTLAEVQGLSMKTAFYEYLRTNGGVLSLILFVVALVLFPLGMSLVKNLAEGKLLLRTIIPAACLFLIGAYTQARLSHAAASDFLPEFSVLVNMIHLMGKGLWVGSILVLFFVFLPAFIHEDASEQLLKRLYTCLGKLIAAALILGAPSGIWIVWLHLKSPTNLFTTDWGKVLLILLGFASLLFVLRMCSFFIFERMKRCNLCVRSFTVLEVLAALAVSFFSALMIITTPPLPADGSHVVRQFGIFEAALVLCAFGFIMFGIFLFRIVEKRERMIDLLPLEEVAPPIGKLSLAYGISVLVVLLFGAIALFVTHFFF